MINHQRKLGRLENRGNLPINVGGIFRNNLRMIKEKNRSPKQGYQWPAKRTDILQIIMVHIRSLGQGNISTHVCHSVHGGGGYLYDVNSCLAAWSHVPFGGSLSLVPCPFWRGYLSQGISVSGGLCILRILLECILVFKKLTEFLFDLNNKEFILLRKARSNPSVKSR